MKVLSALEYDLLLVLAWYTFKSDNFNEMVSISCSANRFETDLNAKIGYYRAYFISWDMEDAPGMRKQ